MSAYWRSRLKDARSRCSRGQAAEAREGVLADGCQLSTQVPANALVPFTYVEIDPSRAGSSGAAFRSLLIGQRLASGTVAAGSADAGGQRTLTRAPSLAPVPCWRSWPRRSGGRTRPGSFGA